MKRAHGLILGLALLVSSTTANLLHVWSFEVGLQDTVGNLTGVSTNSTAHSMKYPNICGNFLHTGSYGHVDFDHKALNSAFSGDFLISLMVMVPDINSSTIPILSIGGSCLNGSFLTLQFKDSSSSLVLAFGNDTQSVKSLLAPNITDFRTGFQYVSIGRRGSTFFLWVNLAHTSIEANVTFNFNFDLSLGSYQCLDPTTKDDILYDELQIYNSYEDPAAIYRAMCIQIAPSPMFVNVAPDHSSFDVVIFNPFYLQFSSARVQLQLDSVVVVSNFSYYHATNMSSDAAYQAVLTTISIFSAVSMISAPSTLLPVGKLRHVYSFEGSLADAVSSTSIMRVGDKLNTSIPGVCGKAIGTFNGTTRSFFGYIFGDVEYANDFTISFWMRIDGDNTTNYVIIGQQSACGNGSFWSLRYFNGQLLFEFSSPPTMIRISPPSFPLFGSWYHIALTRREYTVSMYINGTITSFATMRSPDNPHITSPLGLSDSPCIGIDQQFQAPSLLFDELQIYDRFVDPYQLYSAHPCIQDVPTPEVLIDHANDFIVSIAPSFYEQYTNISYELHYTFNGSSNETVVRCRPCLLRLNATGDYTLWYVLVLPSTRVPSPQITRFYAPRPPLICPVGSQPVNLSCTPIGCGDKNCSAEETCVSCPIDCGIEGPCNSCGDGVCNANETCTSCKEDCACVTNLTCEPPCIHGSCSGGHCVCNDSWSGPSCSTRNLEMVSQFNLSRPATTISTPAQSGRFLISIGKLTELGPDLNTSTSYSVDDLKFSLSTSQNGSNWLHNYTATLVVASVQCTLTVLMYQFRTTTKVEFAGSSDTFAPNTLKVSILIQNWPFQSTGNFLAVVIHSNALNQTNSEPPQPYSDQNKNLRWLLVNDHAVDLYVQLLNVAVIDGRVRKITYTQQTDSISAIIPHFWRSAEVDPHYNVLLRDDKQKGGGGGVVGGKVVMAVAASVAVVIVVVILIIVVVLPRLRLKYKVQESKHAIKLQEEENNSSNELSEIHF